MTWRRNCLISSLIRWRGRNREGKQGLEGRKGGKGRISWKGGSEREGELVGREGGKEVRERERGLEGRKGGKGVRV